MSGALLVRHCSPTLAGIKTGNMFVCRYDNAGDMRSSVRLWNKTLSGKGLRVLPLRYRNEKALIYIYRPRKLKEDLADETACRLLLERGYHPDNPEGCVANLVRRVSDCEEFPHEIGLFLGYPPEDVCGFIENKACNCKCIGCWKVYGDEQAAQRLFEKYKKCTEIYCTEFAKGRSIERLTVAG